LLSSTPENSGTAAAVTSWYPGSILGGATGYSQNTTRPMRLQAMRALRCRLNVGTRRQISNSPTAAVTVLCSTT
jgi:hypothetical protein